MFGTWDNFTRKLNDETHRIAFPWLSSASVTNETKPLDDNIKSMMAENIDLNHTDPDP